MWHWRSARSLCAVVRSMATTTTNSHIAHCASVGSFRCAPAFHRRAEAAVVLMGRQVATMSHDATIPLSGARMPSPLLHQRMPRPVLRRLSAVRCSSTRDVAPSSSRGVSFPGKAVTSVLDGSRQHRNTRGAHAMPIPGGVEHRHGAAGNAAPVGTPRLRWISGQWEGGATTDFVVFDEGTRRRVSF